MPRKVRGKSDDTLDAIMAALATYEAQHPRAKIEGYRQNSVSIRIRIIDPDFAGIGRAEVAAGRLRERYGTRLTDPVRPQMMIRPLQKDRRTSEPTSALSRRLRTRHAHLVALSRLWTKTASQGQPGRQDGRVSALLL